MRLLVFGGTSEGRQLCKLLNKKGYEVTISVATDYGARILEKIDNCKVLIGRQDERQMEKLMDQNCFDYVIDATHPYAVKASETIKKVCTKAHIPLLHLKREVGDISGGTSVPDATAAAIYLMNTQGNILLTTGSKELASFSILPRERLYVRILPCISSLSQCLQERIPPHHICCMQGPFSEEMNVALLRQWEIRYLVTKCSGKAGGFVQKMAAARKMAAEAVIIDRPREDEGIPMEELLLQLEKSGKGELRR